MGIYLRILNCLLEHKNTPNLLRYICCYLMQIVIAYPAIRYIEKNEDYCLSNKIDYFGEGWTNKETFGQKYVMEQLGRHVNSGSKLLHIGIGNSNLYEQCRLCKCIHGVTVIYREWEKGKKYNDCKYIVYLIDKNDPHALKSFLTKYDVIIDPHLKSYACCNYHFDKYLEILINSLNPNGMILTHIGGFNYHVKYGYKNILTKSEIKSICNKLGTQVVIKVNYKGVVTIAPV